MKTTIPKFRMHLKRDSYSKPPIGIEPSFKYFSLNLINFSNISFKFSQFGLIFILSFTDYKIIKQYQLT